MNDTVYRIMTSGSVGMDGANDGIIITLLIIAVVIVLLKPNFSNT